MGLILVVGVVMLGIGLSPRVHRSTARPLRESVLAVAALDRAFLRAARPAASEKTPTEGELHE